MNFTKYRKIDSMLGNAICSAVSAVSRAVWKWRCEGTKKIPLAHLAPHPLDAASVSSRKPAVTVFTSQSPLQSLLASQSYG
jgi:hypothetical protein